MLLAVDVGNTNTVFGIFGPDGSGLRASVRMSTRRDRMPDEWYAILAPCLAANGISGSDITAMIVSSVVPSVTHWLTEMGRLHLRVEPIVVGIHLDLGIEVEYDHPAEIGADRLVNAIAARHRYGAPVISIDFGTALNFDVVNHRGHYVGGSLAPGPLIALEAMTSRAARLFSVDLAPPPAAIARNTAHAIQSGLVLGYLALVEGMIRRISAELEGEPTVVVTGGYAELFAAQTDLIDAHDPDLTLEGLRLIYERIREGAGRTEPSGDR